ncbi:MAPK/MAK/MRK overlapping kinase-like isoform X4 [Sebastes umbrosus]|uniref:MAPK/MAK/MRK overlapping kinase-like isoform X4 n=1 Tax=Sebastes umbrosus TaxID=72105 RepID=UPI0018A0D7C9|nr:MAPK/MAK/MRK overlapping kinase-like isoform X4 [Sebastes umbrosus]
MVGSLASKSALMMHYSNWLIGVKNRASLRNACKTPGNVDYWNKRGNNPQRDDDENTSELDVATHLWKKGYKTIKKIGEGTFSEVVKTQSLKDGKYYACKTMKQTINSDEVTIDVCFEILEQANNLREVQAMKRLSPHANIIQLHELIFDKETGTVSLICELMEMNIYEFIQGRHTPLPDSTVKNYMYQLCKSLEHMHSLNPLFPGTNELDQVAKIHDVLGTPDESILQKFKQSRAVNFDFPPKKGSGISRLLPHCPAPALSLLYQMLAYDPDERITAETALRHTYFREVRLAEKKVSGTMEELEISGTHNSLDHIWRPARLGKQLRGRHTRQTPLISHNLKHVAEPLIRRNVPHHPTELPKINMVVPGPQISFPVSTMPAFTVTHRGTLPTIASKKCQTRLAKPRDESHRAAFKTYYIPPLDRKHGGY